MNNLFAETTAVILAGGLGTRLRSMISDRPKVLAEVAGKPFMHHLLRQLGGAGITRAIISTGYMAEKVEEAFGSEYEGMQIGYSREYEQLGTGGALRLASGYIHAPQVLVMNGDSYCDADLLSFGEFHKLHNADFSMVLARVPNIERFGQVQTDGDRITSFMEKGAAQGEGWINAGIYLARTEIFDMIPQQMAVSLEREIFPRLLDRKFYAYRTEGRFIDIGTPESYLQAENFFTPT